MRVFFVDLPDEVAGMVASECGVTVVLVNATAADERGREWTRALANSLLGEVDATVVPLRAVV